MAEGVGFEPTSPCGPTVFKTVAFNRSATPPRGEQQSSTLALRSSPRLWHSGGVFVRLLVVRRATMLLPRGLLVNDDGRDVDRTFMTLALDEARKAGAIGEVPIGAVVVCDGAVVAT